MTKALIAKIHIAKAQMALDDDAYRAVLRRVTGRASSRDCTAPQLEAVLAEFKRLGWVPKSRNVYSSHPHVRKVYALWKEAAQVGAVSNGSKEALRAFVKRQTGKETPEFLTPPDANKVTEALKAMIRRAEG